MRSIRIMQPAKEDETKESDRKFFLAMTQTASSISASPVEQMYFACVL